MAKALSPEQLGKAIREELALYNQVATDRVNQAGRKSIKKLVKLTKVSAPTGERGSFRSNITSKETATSNGMKVYTWGVKAPDYRLTHLLVHGHATRNGKRTRANPFLQNALDVVLPEYEDAVKEALIHD